MSGESSGWFEDVGDDPRGRALLMLFVAFSTLPLVISFALVDPVSIPTELAGVAVGGGIVCGGGLYYLGESLDEPLLSGYSQFVALVGTAAGTVAIWWVLSSEEIRAFAVGSVVFVWTGALCTAARHLLLPRLAGRA